jgi:hypothetical protein
MNKKPSVLIILGLFFLLENILSVPVLHSYAAPYWYNPEDSTLEDNAYSVTDYFSLQWWYIDAVFDNNYSTHVGIMTVGSKGINGFFLFRINVYKDGALLEGKFRLVPVRFVEVSPSEPVIKLFDKEIIRGYIDDDGRMALTVSLEIKGLQADLTLVGLIKGWKGFTGHGMWGCPLPKAHVQGTITVNDETIPVSGVGYQERGWDVRHLHRSWFWGKFASNHTNVVFSKNMKNRWEEDTCIVVVNSGEENYTSIARENIVFHPTDYAYNHGRFIPTKSVFQVDEDDIHIHVEIEVQSIHFTSLIVMNHWRFHTKVTGTISIGNRTENVDDVQIMEIFHYP